MKRWLGVLVAVAVLGGCASVNKQCFGNGVCRTDTNGVVTWEGPPDKVAELQAAEEAEKKAAAERDAAFKTAERRGANEPIRLAVLGLTAGSADLQAHVGAYNAMLMEALQGDPRIQLVPPASIRHLVQPPSSGHFGRSKGSAAVGLDEALARRLRDGSSEVDVVLVVTASEKAKTGMVKGGGGSGVAQVVNVEFRASLSPVYAFNERHTSEIGKSNTGLALAGVDKKGKASTAQLKGKRNPDQDRGAVQGVAQWAKRVSAELAATELPSLAAVQEINQRLATQRKGQASDALKKMLGGQP